MNRIILIVVLITGCLKGIAQDKEYTVQEYIDRFKDLAISEMQRTGVPASVTLAQGILESENGNGALVRKSNNHFGIKCKSSWTGNSVSHNDDERGECFRKYDSAEESYRDHSDFLKGSDRYASLFSLDPRDYKAWCYGLKRAGYATNPRYPEILIKYIDNYNLQQYSLIALGGRGPVQDLAYSPGSGYSAGGDISMDSSSSDETAPSEPRVENFHGLNRIFVSAGTSLLALASRLDISLSRLMEYNDLESDGLLNKNQWIYTERKKAEGVNDSYIAGAGATLWDVSQITGVQRRQLLLFNPDVPASGPIDGLTVWLKPGHINLTDGKKKNDIIHEVKYREGLYSISKKYNVTIEDIKTRNKLAGNQVRPGQQLVIPQP
jgi:hypothetical protein